MMTSRPGPGSVCTNVSATTVLLQTLVNVLADRASRQSGSIITIIIGTKMRLLLNMKMTIVMVVVMS